MVRIIDEKGKSRKRVEEALYSTDDNVECELVAEIHGVQARLSDSLVLEQIDNHFGDSAGVSRGKPIEIRWRNDRADYQELKKLSSELQALVMNDIAGRPHTATSVVRAMSSTEDLRGSMDYRDLLDDVGIEAVGRSMREFDLFLKPYRDEFAAQGMVPRPTIIFEVQYDVPRGAEVKTAVKVLRERIGEGLTPNAIDIVVRDKVDAILVIPLQTLVDTKDWSISDFDSEGIAEIAAERITGKSLGEAPRMNRVIATCGVIPEGGL